MRLDTEFIRLPLQFDAARLAAEVNALPESAWQPHPEGHPGNAGLPLVALDGNPLDHGTRGAMRPTPQLAVCPYLRQVLATLQAPIGRTRLMRIDGNAEATAHVDVNYYWQQRMRVHVPIVTDPAVRFVCGDRAQFMAPGETWIFDTWRLHNVINPTSSRRIHLVADTVGSPVLAALVQRGWQPFGAAPHTPFAVQSIDWQAQADPPLALEESNFPLVMAPAEQQTLFHAILVLLPADDAAAALQAEVAAFLDAWRARWQRHADTRSGWAGYAQLLEQFAPRVLRLRDRVRLSNGVDAAHAVQQILLAPALNTDLARPAGAARPRPHIERPVFIVSAPRSGSSMLFEALIRSPDAFSIGGESHVVIEGIDALHPAAAAWQSNRLLAPDAIPASVAALRTGFADAARDRDGRAPHGAFRLVEKTPKNSLRIPFLRAAFPDALFVYLYRDERATISSMLDAWRSGRFVTYPDAPGWSGPAWSLALTPGWRDLAGRPLAEVVVRQWQTVTDTVLDDLQALPPEVWCVASYDRLVADPQREIERLCAFLDLRWDQRLRLPLPASRYTLTPPDPAKWLANSALLEPLLPRIATTAERARAIFAQPPLQRVTPAPAALATVAAAPAFASVFTSNVPELLTRLNASLLVSTYQSGRVIVLRADGADLNTHLRYFPSPMGLACDGQRLAIGTLGEIWDYRNMPDSVARLHPDRHDACFMPRNMHVTGDIRVHELAFAGDGELWAVNTRFSTLCTFDRDHSFVPRWRPHFVSALAAEDRCHLNGLCMQAGQPYLVTALGRSDSFEGWRARKSDGGVLIEVAGNEIVAGGLSMPHSPRCYDGRVWLLESARGTLVTIDPGSGQRTTVAELPGFTRGLAFAGRFAFVGLSQVRESVFDDIPLGQRLPAAERCCGVWVIDIDSGASVGFVKFEDTVQEIFDIQLLAGMRYPELLEPDADLIGASFVLSADALREVAVPQPR